MTEPAGTESSEFPRSAATLLAQVRDYLAIGDSDAAEDSVRRALRMAYELGYLARSNETQTGVPAAPNPYGRTGWR